MSKLIQVLQDLGKTVVSKAQRNLVTAKPYSKKTSSNTLYDGMQYTVKGGTKGVELEWSFGGAEDYWEFVDQGVRGSGKSVGGTTKSGKQAKSGGKGTIRALQSPFKFTNKMPPRRFIDKWIVSKPLKSARNSKGQFITRKSMAFLIQRSIFRKGLYRTLFFTKPYEEEVKKFMPKIMEAYADDLELQLQTLLK